MHLKTPSEDSSLVFAYIYGIPLYYFLENLIGELVIPLLAHLL